MSTTATANGNDFDFDNLTLADVNPDIEPLPEGEYDFQVIEASKNIFEYKEGTEKAGQTGTYIKFGLSVINDPVEGGRRVYQTLFADNKTPRFLRLVMDATGIPQTGTISEWLDNLVTSRAEFHAPSFVKQNKKSGKLEAQVRFGQVAPIQ